MNKKDDNFEFERSVLLSDNFHSRSQTISSDLNKLTISLSTGVIALFFVGLIDPKNIAKLETMEIILMLLATVSFGLSIANTMGSMYLNAELNYLNAIKIDPVRKLKNQEKIKSKISKYRRIYNKIRFGGGLFFLTGILLAVTFMLFRVM